MPTGLGILDDSHRMRVMRAADDLDATAVLVRPDVGHRVGGAGLAADGRRDQRRVFLGVGPVLDSHAPEDRVRPVRDVAGRVDVLVADSTQGRLAADPVGQVQAGAGQPLHGRDGTDAHYHQVGLQRGAVGQDELLDSARSVYLCHRRPAPHFHAGLGVQPAQQPAHLRAESSPRSNSTAFTLTTIRRSKSSPVLRPRYSCVGRAKQ